MREDQLLRAIARRSEGLAGLLRVIVGPGDDCAAVFVDPPGEHRANLLITTDQLIEGRHIEALAPGEPPGDRWLDAAARKCVARSLSDLAAMAAAPLAAVATGALPRGPRWTDERADYLFERLKHWSERYACPLVGGDIATIDGPLVLSCTALGVPHPARGPVLRSTARAGDAVWVTGALGGSLESGRHGTFEPRLAEAAALADALGHDLRAMMDLSDGLAVDGARLGEASGVCLRIEADSLPIHADVDSADRIARALGDGEDYELLLAIDGGQPDDAVRGALRGLGTAITRIGIVEPVGPVGPWLRVVDRGGRVIDLAGLGWLHG